jgi:hypothetical protein
MSGSPLIRWVQYRSTGGNYDLTNPCRTSHLILTTWSQVSRQRISSQTNPSVTCLRGRNTVHLCRISHRIAFLASSQGRRSGSTQLPRQRAGAPGCRITSPCRIASHLHQRSFVGPTRLQKQRGWGTPSGTVWLVAEANRLGHQRQT